MGTPKVRWDCAKSIESETTGHRWQESPWKRKNDAPRGEKEERSNGGQFREFGSSDKKQQRRGSSAVMAAGWRITWGCWQRARRTKGGTEEKTV